MNEAIPEPIVAESGLPIPKGARLNRELSGATSVNPGRNYTIAVYDVDTGVEAMTAFYAHHLRDATRAIEGREVRFSMPKRSVRLVPLNLGTRITLTTGPH